MLPLLLTALLSRAGLVGVRVRGHDRPPGPVAHVLGRGARGGGQVDDRVTAQQVSVLGTQYRSPAQGNDALSRSRGVQDGPHGPVLTVTEALLAFGGEDLRDRHAGSPADLGVGVGDLQPEGRGEQARHRYALWGYLGFIDAACLHWVERGCPDEERWGVIDAALGALEGGLGDWAA